METKVFVHIFKQMIGKPKAEFHETFGFRRNPKAHSTLVGMFNMEKKILSR
jgi:hypothetical protein